MFIVKELYVKGYIWLMNGGNNEIHYTPKERLQFIIGSNGSGKSTLINLLIPHVPTSTLFTDEGLYILTVEKDGVEYTLSYSKSPKPQFTFQIDAGDNLNLGGTGTVQNKLIEQYIKIDQDVIGILLGTERFSSMTPAKRKQWMSRLSPTNVDTIIEAFTKANEKVKSTNNNIQYLQKKVLQTTEALNKLGDDKEVREQSQLVSELLDSLYPLKTKIPNITPLDMLSESITQITNNYIAVCDNVDESITINGNTINLVNLEEIANAVNLANKEYELAKQSYLLKAEELTHLNEHLAAIERLDSLEILEQKLAQQTPVHTKLLARFNSQYPTDTLDDLIRFDVEVAKDTLYANGSSLVSDMFAICSQLKPDPDNTYSKHSLVEKETYLTKLLSDKALLESEIAHAKNIIIGCENSEHVKCKRCGNEWRSGYDEIEVKAARELISYKTEHLDIVLSSIESIHNWIEGYNSYRRDISILTGISTRYPILHDLMTSILSDSVIKHNPKSAMAIINSYLDKIDLVIKIKRSLKIITELESQIADIGSSNQHDISLRYSRKLTLEKDLELLECEMRRWQSVGDKLKVFQRYSQQYFSALGELNQINTKVNRHAELYHEKIEAEVVDSLISDLQITLGRLKEDLDKRNSLTRSINELESSILEEKGYLEHYKLIAEGLGPTGGLLAEQLSVSINAIVEGINLVIGELWKSDLYIIPCGIEEGELTYRFPFNGINSKDVSGGSNGQRDIVDLAFRIMVYQLMGLKQYPLFLDEMGCFFDKAHKTSLTRYISECLEDGTFSQVFYISHAIEQYISAGSSEINVLCERNVTLPSVYNTNLKLA